MPKKLGDDFVFYHEENGEIGVTKLSLDTLDNIVLKEFREKGKHVLNPRECKQTLCYDTVKKKKAPAVVASKELDAVPYKTDTLSKLPWARKSVSGWAGGGWAPSSGWAGIISARFVLTDIPMDHILAGNIFSNFESFTLAHITYADLPKKLGASAYIQDIGDLTTIGARGVRVFPQNKYLRLSAFGGYEYRKWEEAKGHAAIGGGSLTLDTTTRDWYGPIDGWRVYAASEAGFSASRGELDNVDVNVDIRRYWYLTRKSNFALRLAGGTSQGSNPTRYILGGVDDMKGAPLFGVVKQNYWHSEARLSFPLAQVAGAIMPEDVINLSTFTSAWDLRGSLFAYVGDAFNNSDIDKGLVDVPNYGFGVGVHGIWIGMPWHLTYTLGGKVDPNNGKDSFGWNKGSNLFFKFDRNF